MELVLSRHSVSVSELRKRAPSAILEESFGEAVAILNHNKPEAYIVTPAMFEAIMDMLEDVELSQVVHDRAHEKAQAKSINLDDL